ncbi:MAG TPA: ribosome recycling factor [Blastocatellia bacterium]
MDPELYGEDDRSEAVKEDSSDIELLVRRSDDDLALFDSQRIVDALVRETNLDRELATQISLDVRKFIEKLGPRALSSSLIRGLVDAKLLELGLEEAHRAHTRLGVPFYDVHRIIQSSFRESISQPRGPEGTSLMLAEAIKREYAIQSVFSEQIANAHLVGDIHIHEIGAIDRPYSIMSSVDYVKQFGISLPQGFASSAPARRADVLVAHIIKVSAAMQGYISGPVVWDSLLNQLASFHVPEPRMVVIQPFDKSSLGAIEKAIRNSDLGVNPSNDGVIIRVVFPELTEERRREYIKTARSKAEDSRVSIRNVRRHAKDALDKLVKNSEAGEDEVRRAERDLQELTDQYVAQIDELLKHKEAELLEV